MWKGLLTVILCLSCSTLFAGTWTSLIATQGAIVLLQSRNVVKPTPPEPDIGRIRIMEIPVENNNSVKTTTKSCGPNRCR